MHRKMAIGCSVAALMIVMIFGSPVGAETLTVTLEHPAYQIAVDPQTSVLAAVDPDDSLVVFYPNLLKGHPLKGVTQLETPKSPIGIVYKKFGDLAYFVAVCHDQNRAMFISPTTSKSVTEVPLSIAEPSSVFCSDNAADPYVYYCGGRGHESRAGVIDLRVMKDVGTTPSGEGMGASVMEGAVSADGSVLNTRGPWSPSGFASVVLIRGEPGEPPKGGTTFYEHTSKPMYLPDPFGQYVVVGKELYSPDLRKQIGSVDIAPIGFMRDKPFMIAVDDGRLLAISSNTLKQAGHLDVGPIPGGDAPQFGGRRPKLNVADGQADFKSFNYSTRTVADPKTAMFVIYNYESVLAVPSADLKVADEPLLVADVQGDTTLAVDVPASLRIGAARSPRIN